ncbi:hypothetical protein ACLOJK_012860 [Asimina triloba]
MIKSYGRKGVHAIFSCTEHPENRKWVKLRHSTQCTCNSSNTAGSGAYVVSSVVSVNTAKRKPELRKAYWASTCEYPDGL